jgi:hypothetical protein
MSDFSNAIAAQRNRRGVHTIDGHQVLRRSLCTVTSVWTVGCVHHSPTFSSAAPFPHALENDGSVPFAPLTAIGTQFVRGGFKKLLLSQSANTHPKQC